MTELEQIRFDVLTKLKEILDNLNVTSVIREPEEGLPTYVLTTLHRNLGYQNNEVMGEFYFLPLNEEGQKFHYFTAVMTLDEEVPQERYEELSMAATMLNFYLPVGAFVLEKNGGLLAYKYTALLPTEAGVDELISLLDGAVGVSLSLTDQYVDPFMQLLYGQITLEQFELELPDVHFA